MQHSTRRPSPGLGVVRRAGKALGAGSSRRPRRVPWSDVRGSCAQSAEFANGQIINPVTHTALASQASNLMDFVALIAIYSHEGKIAAWQGDSSCTP